MEGDKFIYDSPIKNEEIDIYAVPDIKTKEIKTDNDKEMRIIIEGNNVDYSIINSLRRTILMYIPIYGFHRSNINIEVDKCKYMYNNDLIYNQIETLPIYDVPNYFDLENPETYMSNEVIKSLFHKFIPEEIVSDNENKTIDAKKKLFKIELSINLKNTDNSDKFVTTHDCILKIDGKISDSYKIRKPICIIVLKPTEEISLRAEANLGISKLYASYEATTNAIHIEHNTRTYEIMYETLEQLDKKIIFSKACIILIKKLENLSKFIKDKYGEEKNKNELIEIEIYGEEHTLGNLLATTLQRCKYISSAGYVLPHLFSDQIIIRYRVVPKSKVEPIQILIDVINYLINVFKIIIKDYNHNK